MAGERCIRLRGVAVHNLQRIDLDLPHRRLIVLCGVSGSGKSSLALDTLYAEGQRRYIESFSAGTRQFLQRLEKPEAELIDGLPPAIAVTRSAPSKSSRTTVGTATETNAYLQLLFAKIGQLFCLECGREVRRETPQIAAETLTRLPTGTRYLVAFAVSLEGSEGLPAALEQLRQDGFARAIVGSRLVPLEEALIEDLKSIPGESDLPGGLYAIVDRLTAGGVTDQRLRDSLETAQDRGRGRWHVFVESLEPAVQPVDASAPPPAGGIAPADSPGTPFQLEGQQWRRLAFSERLSCEACQREYPDPEPRLFNFNSPLGACPQCEGFGSIADIDMDRVVPDKSKTLRDGAVVPWNTPAYAHELKELLTLARDYGLRVDVPFGELTDEERRLIVEGAPERSFGGLRGFFAWLERRKYKMHLRVFLSRWRSYRTCPACHGSRLRPEALATRVGGKNIAQIAALKAADAAAFFRDLELRPWQRSVARSMLAQLTSRLGYLEAVGLGYLTLDRTLRTLSSGEAQRVSLTGALGSSLVNLLYVLDEPSIGLHPHDTARLIAAIRGLTDRGNTVVAVDHDEAVIRAADHAVEIGPGPGERGGRVVFQAAPAEMADSILSITGDYLSGRRSIRVPDKRRASERGWIRLAGARGNNLQNVTVEFPLGVCCVVTGVSGSGKSTLVEGTLYPALCARLRKEGPAPCPFDEVLGDGQIEDCILVDQSPLGRSSRSNPVTYIKAFDEIRAVFAETVDARTHNYTASQFSFNIEGGRCPACEGDGYVRIDMQFLPDVFMRCSECQGRRYRRDLLEVTYRGANIADVLDMTVREAFVFFRGRPKVQGRLKKLIDVGLDYLRLGQPANTLSGGEAQRMKLAGYLSSARRGRSLFVLDEPTAGLHSADIVQLLDCFDALLAVGHSLIVVEHNLHVIKSADYIIDLGPGPADEGGRVVASGTPEQVARSDKSVTGRYLAAARWRRTAGSDPLDARLKKSPALMQPHSTNKEPPRPMAAASRPLARLEVFFGDASPAKARVYAQLPAEGLPAGCRLAGSVRGPVCRYSQTLQTTSALATRGEGPMLLAETILPDPCFWSTEMPFLYRVHVELIDGIRTLESIERLLGIHPLGIRGRKLLFAGKPCVIRGVRQQAVEGEHELTAWRASDAAVVANSPDDELCREASELGVLVIADLRGGQEKCADEIFRFARWPAVAMVIVDESAVKGLDGRGSRNLIVAARRTPDSGFQDLRGAVVRDASDIESITRFAAANAGPIFAIRPAEQLASVEQARRQCDALQRDLAGRGEFVGYIV